MRQTCLSGRAPPGLPARPPPNATQFPRNPHRPPGPAARSANPNGGPSGDPPTEKEKRPGGRWHPGRFLVSCEALLPELRRVARAHLLSYSSELRLFLGIEKATGGFPSPESAPRGTQGRRSRAPLGGAGSVSGQSERHDLRFRLRKWMRCECRFSARSAGSRQGSSGWQVTATRSAVRCSIDIDVPFQNVVEAVLLESVRVRARPRWAGPVGWTGATSHVGGCTRSTHHGCMGKRIARTLGK